MILKMPGFKDLLEKLSISPASVESIARFSLDDYELSFAEAVLLYEGAILGVADCRIPEWEKKAKKLDFYNFCISAELLELLLMPNIAKQIFSKDKIVIRGAHIYRRSDMMNIKKGNTAVRSQYVLNVPDTTINIDITFKDCVFNGGINLQNTQTRSLIFERVELNYSLNSVSERQESFSGMNLKVKGDLIFTHYNKESHDPSEKLILRGGEAAGGLPKDELTEPHIRPGLVSTSNDYSVYASGVNLDNAFIEGRLHFEKIKINGTIDCTSLRAGRMEITHCQILNNLILFRTFIEGAFVIDDLRLDGKISGYNLKAYRLEISNSIIKQEVSLTYAKIEHLFACIETKIFGGFQSYDAAFRSIFSLEARGMVAGDVFLRDGFVAHNGIDLFHCEIKGSIDISRSFIAANMTEGWALNLEKANVGKDVKLSPKAIFIGTVSLNDATIDGNILLARSKFLNLIDEPNNYAISAKNTRVGKSLIFASANHRSRTLPDDYVDMDSPASMEDLYYPTLPAIKNRLLASRSELYEQHERVGFNIIKSVKNNSDKNGKADDFVMLQDKYFGIHQKDEAFVIKTLNHYEQALDFLFSCPEQNRDPVQNNDKNKFLTDTTIVVGETFLYGIRISGQADFCGALFYGMDHAAIHRDAALDRKGKKLKLEDFPNALTMKFAHVGGELFLNNGPRHSKVSFRACGEVNLHSSKVRQFFLSPECGLSPYSKWKVIGLKYDYIYADEKYSGISQLEQCNWFHPYHQQENNRQPYEELAAAYLRVGDDTKARKVLLRSKARNKAEEATLNLLRGVAKAGSPHYKSLICLIVLFFIGWAIFTRAFSTGAIIAIHKNAALLKTGHEQQAMIFFSPINYSLQNLLPFINAEQKSFFSVSNNSGQNFLPDWTHCYIDSGRITSGYLTIHTYAAVLFLSMFIIGITRIIKRT